MFAMLKRKNPYEQSAQRLYAAALEQVRRPVFYEEYGVEDTFEGRFDFLLLHLFMVMETAQAYPDFNQALFDVAFADMDQVLRQGGIGDMGVPKHMKRMMKAFNGRMHSYSTAWGGKGDATLAQVLARNLYGGREIQGEVLDRMMAYMKRNLEHMAGRDVSDVLDGRIGFID